MFDYAREQVWLDSLKVGDKVAIRYGFDALDVMRVTKTTPTQIHVGSHKYRRKGGYRIGETGRFHVSSIQEFTPEMQAEQEEKKLRNRVRDIQFTKLPLDIIKQILALLPEEKEVA